MGPEWYTADPSLDPYAFPITIMMYSTSSVFENMYWKGKEDREEKEQT